MRALERIFRRGRTDSFGWFTRTERQAVSESVTQVYVEISSHCNLRCITCARNSIVDFRPSHFTPPMAKRLLPMLRSLDRLERIVFMGFGEALCNPHFREILSLFAGADVPMVLVSNASMIDDDMSRFLARLPLEELHLSWDDDPYSSGARIRLGHRMESFDRNLASIIDRCREEGRDRPRIGVQIVMSSHNVDFLGGIVDHAASLGVRNFILSNLYPYTGESAKMALFGSGEKGAAGLRRKIPVRRDLEIRVAGTAAALNRCCPFIERGTLFITSRGDVAPCPELAYTHHAWYGNSPRMHRAYHAGSLMKSSLNDLWAEPRFASFRNDFHYFEFPDCSACIEPDLCYHRTVCHGDCYRNATPCGECLWAKGLILCP